MSIPAQKLVFGLPILLAALGACGIFVVYAQNAEWPQERIQRVGLRLVFGILFAGAAGALALAWWGKL